MSIGQRWPEVVDPPSFWRAEMPKCEVIFAIALRALEAEEKPRDLILGLAAFPALDGKLLPSKNYKRQSRNHERLPALALCDRLSGILCFPLEPQN